LADAEGGFILIRICFYQDIFSDGNPCPEFLRFVADKISPILRRNCAHIPPGKNNCCEKVTVA